MLIAGVNLFLLHSIYVDLGTLRRSRSLDFHSRMDRVKSSMQQVPNPIPKVLSRRTGGANSLEVEKENFERNQVRNCKHHRASFFMQPIYHQRALCMASPFLIYCLKLTCILSSFYVASSCFKITSIPMEFSSRMSITVIIDISTYP